MQREKRVFRRGRKRIPASTPSNVRVSSSIDPPPPFFLGVVGAGVTGGGVVVGVPGVGPEVTGLGQGVVPADAGAALLAPLDSTTTSAVSLWARSSVTVSLKVMEPLVGAITEAVDALAPLIGGGLFVGETTVQA